ncbi:MAG: LuxR C-terminal-related transcriptional regulator [Actinoallomurus sp.]
MLTVAGRDRGSNLPAEVTSFVNRRRELGEIKHLLSIARLVTLTGVGGVGKTRLALRVADEVQRSFNDGVWLVEFAQLKDGLLLARTVAGALDFAEQSIQPPMVMLTENLKNAQMLLVLDNCEHLVDACASLVNTLLPSAAGLRIIATSRQPLGAEGEHIIDVASFSTPNIDGMSHEPVINYDAITLFTDRAVAAAPTFELNDGNVPTVARLCNRLDGIPLAIELAVVRLRALSVEQILERLGNRFDLLSSERRAALPRQQTLRAMIDWSFDLCSPLEQMLWKRLSVFVGSFDLMAVEDVFAGSEVPHEQVTGGLMSLVDKSILVREESPLGPRYRLLETVRQYGQDRLREDGEKGPVRRHRDYYLRLALKAESEYFGPAQNNWAIRLRLELPNLRAALHDFCSDPREIEAGLCMGAALRTLWVYSGFVGEGKDWLGLLLETDSAATRARAKALWVYAWLTILKGDITTAITILEEGRSIAEQLGDESSLAYIANLSCMALMVQGDISSAGNCADEAFSRHRATMDTVGMVHDQVRQATVALLSGNLDFAIDICEECIDRIEGYREQWLRSYVLWFYGIAVWRKGDLKRATELERESIKLKDPFDDVLGYIHCLGVLAWIAENTGQHERCALIFGALDSIRRETGLTIHNYLMSYHDQSMSDTRRVLGDLRYKETFHRGAKLSIREAIVFALEEVRRTDVPGCDRSNILTHREWDVAQLISQGLSNKKIADKLVISQRTAEGHVENILTKLGFRSRAQVARWVAEHE